MAFKNNNIKNTKNVAAGGHGKCCNSDTKLWKTVQAALKSNDMEAWAQLAGDDHRVPQLTHVLLKNRVENDVRRMSPSQRHQLIQFNKEIRAESMRLFGVSVKDLNAVQVALFHGNEDLACQVVRFVSEQATANELRLFLNHTWGYRNSSLHLAAFFGMPTLVQLLLDLGADSMVINRKNMAPADCCAGNDACLALLCPDMPQEDNDDLAKDDNVMIPTAVITSAPDVSNETPAMSEDDSDNSDDDEMVVDSETTVITTADTFSKAMVATSKDSFTELEAWQPIKSNQVVTITCPTLYDTRKSTFIADMALSKKDIAEVVSWYSMESIKPAMWPIMDDGDGCKTALLQEMTLSDRDIAEVVSWHQVHDNNAAAITWPVMDDGDGCKTALLQEMALPDDDIAEIVSWHQVQDNNAAAVTWPVMDDDNNEYKTAFFADKELPSNDYIKSLQDVVFVPDLAKLFALPVDGNATAGTMAITTVKNHVSTSLEPSGDLEPVLNLDLLFGAEDPCLSAPSCKQSDGLLHDTLAPISTCSPSPLAVAMDHVKVPETKSDDMLILDCQESGDTSPTVVHSGKVEYHMASLNDQMRTPTDHLTICDNDPGLQTPIASKDTIQAQHTEHVINPGITSTAIIEYDNSLGALCGGTTFAKGSAISDLVTTTTAIGEDGATQYADPGEHVSCVPSIDSKDTLELFSDHHQGDIKDVGDTASKISTKMQTRALVKQDNVNIPKDPDAIDHVALCDAVNHSEGSHDTLTTAVANDSSDTTDWPTQDGLNHGTRNKLPKVDKDPDASYQHATPSPSPSPIGRNASSSSMTMSDGECCSAIHVACSKIASQHHHQPTRWQDSSTLYTHQPTDMQSSYTTFYGEHPTGDDDDGGSIHRRHNKDSLTGFMWYNSDTNPHAVLHGRIFSSSDTWPSSIHHDDDNHYLKHPGASSKPIVNPIHPAWVSKPDLVNSIRNDCLAPDDGSWYTYHGASPPGTKERSLVPLCDSWESLQPLLDPGSDTSLKNRYDSGGGGQGSQYWMHDPYLMLSVATVLSEQLVQVVNQLGIFYSSAVQCDMIDSFPMSVVRGQAVAVS
ncbi:hypothetical protein K492DRAFT_208052 [Lichtheimia hyalospora FSU 10163]|nr:hypothetical protein K492DRAFT_208052 [Lichtheimia hyalospora FSU 10163]